MVWGLQDNLYKRHYPSFYWEGMLPPNTTGRVMIENKRLLSFFAGLALSTALITQPGGQVTFPASLVSTAVSSTELSIQVLFFSPLLKNE